MNDENIKCIEEFLMDIEILEEINSATSRFNAFETLGIVNNEIRHSNMLAWLFNPNENHGLDDMFLKKFIQKIIYNNRDIEFDLITVSLMDYYDFIVRREYEDIDLLIYSKKNKFVLVIENKIWSKESINQLDKYKNIVEDKFSDYKKMYFFLTPEGETPSDENNWNIITYELILETLEESLKFKQDEISKPVKYFIEQYITMLRRHIVKDSELEKICVDIYLKHKKALDLIFEYKPDIYKDISDYIQKLIKDRENNKEGIYLDISNKNYIRFSTEDFDKNIPREGNGWTKSKRILLYEICQKSDEIKIKLIIGPTDNYEIREKLFELYKQNKKILNVKNAKLTNSYTSIYSHKLMEKNYIERYDSNLEEIKKEIKNNLDKFFKGDFIKIKEILKNIKLNTEK